MNPLTERQLTCLQLAADGLTYGEIGAKLGVSHSVVRDDLIGVRAYLGADNTQEAIAVAYRTGLLPMEVTR
jgi:DNA-binding CsgD family transcriptional regulator